MEPLEFDFMREPARGFLDLELPEHARPPRRLSRLSALKREVRRLDPAALADFCCWVYQYDLDSWERRHRREARAIRLGIPSSRDEGDLC